MTSPGSRAVCRSQRFTEELEVASLPWHGVAAEMGEPRKEHREGESAEGGKEKGGKQRRKK
eukprot:61103-Rhodomonas_salina.4